MIDMKKDAFYEIKIPLQSIPFADAPTIYHLLFPDAHTQPKPIPSHSISPFGQPLVCPEAEALSPNKTLLIRFQRRDRIPGFLNFGSCNIEVSRRPNRSQTRQAAFMPPSKYAAPTSASTIVP